MCKKLFYSIALLALSCCYLNVNGQISVAVMSIHGSEIKHVLDTYTSGVVSIQFKTNNGSAFFAQAQAYNTSVTPPFTNISLQKLVNVPVTVDTFVLPTLKWKYSLDSLPDGAVDTSKTYYLIPYYDNPYIIYKISLVSFDDLLKQVDLPEYKNLNSESFGELDPTATKQVLDKLNQLLVASKSFNPIPPQLLP
ncbi:hypothetical protein [Parafilimonas sp.]|uniref:hypothetical protein n=1 Tax=Parafilimonas sp. TaxID=1969739 RepID=UPI0039E2AE69